MNKKKQLTLFKSEDNQILKTKTQYYEFLNKNEFSSQEIVEMYSNVPFEDVRIRILKLLGKEKNIENIRFFEEIIKNKEKKYSNNERREAVSCIGRMRDKDINEKHLLPFLNDQNPEIVLQVIRALLVFKNDANINSKLRSIYYTTDNEIVKMVLDVEFKFESLDFETPNQHRTVLEHYKNIVINGDVLKILENVEDNQVHLTFTSPPYYNARDYSIYSSYTEYLDFLESVFKEVHRITKDGRFLIINTSPIIIPRAGRKYSSKRYPIPFDLHSRLVNSGWEFIDDIIWEKPEASVKNRIGNFMQHKKPLTYKPNTVTEYVMVYRKKSHKLIDWNLSSYSADVLQKSLVDEYESTNIWRIDPVFDKVHTAVFPEKLCENVIKYYSMEGDLVFDPFAGSGTLGKVALLNKRNFFLTEIKEDYFERIKENLKGTKINIKYIKEEDIR